MRSLTSVDVDEGARVLDWCSGAGAGFRCLFQLRKVRASSSSWSHAEHAAERGVALELREFETSLSL